MAKLSFSWSRSISSINWAVVLIVVGVLARLGLWLLVSQNPPLLIQGDGGGYEQIARNMVEGHGFSMEKEPPYFPNMLRTPGYSLFISGVYLSVGYRPEIVTLIQNILGLITIYIAYRLAIRLFGKREALIATVLMALDVGLIILANVTLTETVFLIFFVPATYCLFAGIESIHKWIWMFAAGLLFGLATLVRPAGLYLVFLLLPFVWWAIQAHWQQRTVLVVVLLAAYLISLTPWVYRNFQAFGSPVFTLSARSVTLNIHASYIRAGLNGTTLSDEMGRIPREAQHELDSQTMDTLEMRRLIEVKAIAEIKQHPFEYLTLYAKSMTLTLVLPNTNFLANILGILDKPTGIIADMRNRSLTENMQVLLDFSATYLAGSTGQIIFFAALIIEMLVLFVTYVFALVAIIIGVRNQHRVTIVLFLVIIVYFFIITGPIGTGRYRLPAMPYLMILAGYGFVQLQNWLQSRRLQNTLLESES